jgi:hypothetical protein
MVTKWEIDHLRLMKEQKDESKRLFTDVEQRFVEVRLFFEGVLPKLGSDLERACDDLQQAANDYFAHGELLKSSQQNQSKEAVNDDDVWKQEFSEGLRPLQTRDKVVVDKLEAITRACCEWLGDLAKQDPNKVKNVLGYEPWQFIAAFAKMREGVTVNAEFVGQASTVGHKSPASSREGSLAEGGGKSDGLSVRGSTKDMPTDTKALVKSAAIYFSILRNWEWKLNHPESLGENKKRIEDICKQLESKGYDPRLAEILYQEALESHRKISNAASNASQLFTGKNITHKYPLENFWNYTYNLNHKMQATGQALQQLIEGNHYSLSNTVEQAVREYVDAAKGIFALEAVISWAKEGPIFEFKEPVTPQEKTALSRSLRPEQVAAIQQILAAWQRFPVVDADWTQRPLAAGSSGDTSSLPPLPGEATRFPEMRQVNKTSSQQRFPGVNELWPANPWKVPLSTPQQVFDDWLAWLAQQGGSQENKGSSNRVEEQPQGTEIGPKLANEIAPVNPFNDPKSLSTAGDRSEEQHQSTEVDPELEQKVPKSKNFATSSQEPQEPNPRKQTNRRTRQRQGPLPA